MRCRHLAVAITLAMACRMPVATAVDAAPAAAPQKEVPTGDLAQRLEALERDVRELREIVAPIQRRQAAAQRQQELQRRARERRDAEKASFSEAEVAEIEALSKAATQDWGKPEGEAALAALAEKFPKADRTGATYLQVGQMRRDEFGEQCLRLAAERHGDAINAAGVQVGPFARLLLGMRLWNSDRQDEARRLFTEIRDRFPDAVGPRGNLLSEMLPAGWEKAIPPAASPAATEAE
jgi:TolA-binding protein